MLQPKPSSGAALAGQPGEPILNLGRTPLANSLLTVEDIQQPEPEYPLMLVFCPNCSLVQITVTVPPEMLFQNTCISRRFLIPCCGTRRGSSSD